jgi:hypothetical protein
MLSIHKRVAFLFEARHDIVGTIMAWQVTNLKVGALDVARACLEHV